MPDLSLTQQITSGVDQAIKSCIADRRLSLFFPTTTKTRHKCCVLHKPVPPKGDQPCPITRTNSIELVGPSAGITTIAIICIAEGEVVAGFDLAKVTEDDIFVVGTTVLLMLPPPEILYSRIDNEKTFVYERETGLLRRPDEHLETEARRLAERHLISWALERGILEQAEETGVFYMENFLWSLGFTRVRVEVRDGETE